MIAVFRAFLRLPSSRIVSAAMVLALAALSVHLAAFAQGEELDRGRHWVGTWTAEPSAGTANSPSFTGQTLRQIVHTSIGGDETRIRFSNFCGTKPLLIGAAHVALRSSGAAIVPSSDRALTLSAKPSTTIPPGTLVISDPVTLGIPQLADVAVSLYLPGNAGGAQATVHGSAKQTNYVSSQGDYTAATASSVASTDTSWFYLTTMEVAAPGSAGVVVALGDSISDCTECVVDRNSRWPDFLATRLLDNPGGSQIGVLNEFIGGGRLLHDGNGYSGLRRLDRDVLDQPRRDTRYRLLGHQ